MNRKATPMPSLIERGAGYAEALIEQAEADRVPEAVLGYAAAVILLGLCRNNQTPIDVLNEVEDFSKGRV